MSLTDGAKIISLKIKSYVEICDIKLRVKMSFYSNSSQFLYFKIRPFNKKKDELYTEEKILTWLYRI